MDQHDDAAGLAAAILTIDLGAIVANWRDLAARSRGAECAAVVKADGYGLGMREVAPALANAGCRTFFVALLDEALALRRLLPPDVAILVLNGLVAGTEARCAESGVTPVINSVEQLAAWRATALARATALPLALQVDTAMSRYGMSPDEVEAVATGSARLDGLAPVLLMSHLACADTPAHPANARQLERFAAARARLAPVLGPVRASLAASSGIFLGPDYHFDMVRPGAALYGVRPNASEPALRVAATLQVRVMQIRTVPAGATIGYGASYTASGPTRIATIAVGEPDRVRRAGGGNGAVARPPGPQFPLNGRL